MFVRLLAVFLITVCGAARAADLRIGQAAPVTSVDPHFYNAAPNNGLAMHIFDQLTVRGPDAALRPGLATSWTQAGDTAWDFKLRPGVTFHDGAKLTIDDIVFSLARPPKVPNSPGGFAAMVRQITSVETIDPQTLRLHTATPAPNLPGDLAAVAIVSHTAGDAATEDYNAGRAAVGTGAYRLVRYAPGDRVELERNAAWWGPKPDWERVTIRFISNPGARVAALLSGDVDIIDVPPAADLPRLKTDPKLAVTSTLSARMIYLTPGVGDRVNLAEFTDASGQPLGKNPLTDRRVRQALSMAINRQAIADRIMQGTATPTGQWLTPTMFGYVRDLPPPSFDPERARALLAEAGYPKGFGVLLHTPNDRYPNDAGTAQAVAQMWTRVGVQTSVEALPWNAYAVRGAKQEFAVGLWGWGSNTGEAGYTLINVIGARDPSTGYGSSNYGGYANPALDALTKRAMATVDDHQREAVLFDEVRMVADDLPIIPLHQLVNFWAMKKSLTYEPRADERTLAMGVHPAP